MTQSLFDQPPAVFIQSAVYPRWYVNLMTGEFSENPKALRGFCGRRRKDGRLYTPDGIAVDELVFATALKRKLPTPTYLGWYDVTPKHPPFFNIA